MNFSPYKISENFILKKLNSINNGKLILENYNGGQDPINDVIEASDLDSSGNINIADIVALINIILDI